MDVGEISGALAAANVSNGIGVSLMKDLGNLQGDLAARLFSTMGLGQNIDTYA